MVYLGGQRTSATSRLAETSHYTWIDSQGVKHLIEKYDGPVASELSFLVFNNQTGVEDRRIYSIPTIQNITYSQTTRVPKHPTIMGDYKTQFTKTNPATISFEIILKEDLFVDFDKLGADGKVVTESLTIDEVADILENDKYSLEEVLENEQFFTVKELIEMLESLKNDRHVFTLTTNTDLNDMLDNLVIESISYDYTSEAREITSCMVNAVRVSFQNLVYKLVSADTIAGLLVGTSTAATTAKDQSIGLEYLYTDGNIKFNQPTLMYKYTNYQLLDSIITNKFGALPPYYWKSQVIDADAESKAYVYNLALYSQLGIDALVVDAVDDISYKVNFGKIRLTIQRDKSKAEFERLLYGYENYRIRDLLTLAQAGDEKYFAWDSLYSLMNTYPFVYPDGYSIETPIPTDEVLTAFYTAPRIESAQQVHGQIAMDDVFMLGYSLDKMLAYEVEYYNDTTSKWVSLGTHTITGGVDSTFFDMSLPYTFEYPDELEADVTHESIESDWASSSITGGGPIDFTIMVMTVGSLVEMFVFAPGILFKRTVFGVVDE